MEGFLERRDFENREILSGGQMRTAGFWEQCDFENNGILRTV